MIGAYSFEIGVYYGATVSGVLGYRAPAVAREKGSGSSRHNYDVVQHGPLIRKPTVRLQARRTTKCCRCPSGDRRCNRAPANGGGESAGTVTEIAGRSNQEGRRRTDTTRNQCRIRDWTDSNLEVQAIFNQVAGPVAQYEIDRQFLVSIQQWPELMCGDLFTQLGDGPALTEGDVVGPAIAGEDLFKYSSLNAGMGTTVRGLSKFAPRMLALMHGPSFVGDGAAALRALADDCDRRIGEAAHRLKAP